MKNKKKLLTAIAISLIALIGIGAFIWYFPELMPAFGAEHQKTAAKSSIPSSNLTNPTGNAGTSPTQNSGVLRDSVILLSEEESLNIQSKIDTIQNNADGNLSLTFSQLPAEISEEKIGNVIYMPFVKGQFFPETYIAKIDDVKEESGKYIVSLSTPGIDEVFDKFNLNVDSVLTKENLQSVETLPGVNISYEKSDYEKLLLSSVAQKQKYNLQPLVYKSDVQDISANLEQLGSKGNDSEALSMVMEFKDLDLVKLFNLNKKKSEESITIVQPETGMDDDNLTLMVSGKFGLENLKFYNVAEFDVMAPLLFNNLVVGAAGDTVTELKLDANFINMDMGDILHAGNSTYNHERDKDKFTKDLGLIKIQGLKENTFPIAHLIWNIGTVNVTKPYEMGGAIKQSEIDLWPLSVGLVVSVDIEGKFTLKLSAGFNNKESFDFGKRQLIKNQALAFDYLGPIYEDKKNETNWQVGVEASADLDFQFLNFNAGLYCFNVNLTRFTLTGLGTELQGKCQAALSTKEVEEPPLDGYMSLYSKLLWKVNLSGKTLNLLGPRYSGVIDGNLFKLDYTWELWRKNWLEFGELPTNFDKGTMGFNQISAYDDKYIYFKDINGCLSRVKKDNTDRTTLMPDDFFIICAIDKSFIYVLKKDPDGGSFNLCRINKDGTAYRDIADNISNCIMQDDQYLYIVPADEKFKVRRLDKKSLIINDYVTTEKGDGGFFGGENIVQALYNRNDNEYLLVSGTQSWFGSEAFYYIVDKKTGNAVKVPRESQYYYRQEFDDYVQAASMIGAGFLRGAAEKVFWESKDGTISKEVKGISGWNQREEGIFIQNYNTDEITKQNFPYVISLARASDGEIENIWKTVSQQAFFTLQKYKDKWYFIDQTAAEYILYRADDIHSEPQVVKSVPIANYSVGIDKCSTSMVEGIIFFYTIDGDKSRLLYKYDLNTIETNVK